MSNTTPSELHGPAACPRSCSVCDGSHHWIEEAIDWDEACDGDTDIPENDERRALKCWYECKHCDAWATCEYVWALDGHEEQVGNRPVASDQMTCYAKELAGMLQYINERVRAKLSRSGCLDPEWTEIDDDLKKMGKRISEVQMAIRRVSGDGGVG